MYNSPPMPLGVYNNLSRQAHRQLNCCKWIPECCPNDFIPPVTVLEGLTPEFYLIVAGTGVTITSTNVFDMEGNPVMPVVYPYQSVTSQQSTIIYTNGSLKPITPFKPGCGNYYLEITLSNGEVIYTDIFRVVNEEANCCLWRMEFKMDCDTGHILSDFVGHFNLHCQILNDDSKIIKESTFLSDGREQIKSAHLQEAVTFEIKPLYNDTIRFLRSLTMYDIVRMTLPDGRIYEFESFNVESTTPLLENCLYSAIIRATVKTIIDKGCCIDYEEVDVSEGLLELGSQAICSDCYCSPPYPMYLWSTGVDEIGIGYLESNPSAAHEYSLDGGATWLPAANPFFIPIANCETVNVMLRANCDECVSTVQIWEYQNACIECPRPTITAVPDCDTVVINPGATTYPGVTQYVVEYRPIGDPNWNTLGTFAVPLPSTLTGLDYGETYVIRVSYLINGVPCGWSYLNVTTPDLTFQVVPVAADCETGLGSITVTNPMGVGTVVVTINGVAGTTASLPAGTYTVVVSDDCQTRTRAVVIPEGDGVCGVPVINPALNVTADGNVAFSWSAVAGASGYEVAIQTLPGGVWSLPVAVAGTAYEFENLDCDSYAIRVRAIVCGNACEWSQLVTAQIECNCCPLGMRFECESEVDCTYLIPSLVCTGAGGTKTLTLGATNCGVVTALMTQTVTGGAFFPTPSTFTRTVAQLNTLVNNNANPATELRQRVVCGNCYVEFKIMKNIPGALTNANACASIYLQVLGHGLMDASLQTACLTFYDDDIRCNGDFPASSVYTVDAGAGAVPYTIGTPVCGVGFGDTVIVTRVATYLNSPCPDQEVIATVTIPAYVIGDVLCDVATSVVTTNEYIPCPCDSLDCTPAGAVFTDNYFPSNLVAKILISATLSGNIYTIGFTYVSQATPATPADIAQVMADYNSTNGLFGIVFDVVTLGGILTIGWVKCGIVSFSFTTNGIQAIIDTSCSCNCLDTVFGGPACSGVEFLLNEWLGFDGQVLDILQILQVQSRNIIG